MEFNKGKELNDKNALEIRSISTPSPDINSVIFGKNAARRKVHQSTSHQGTSQIQYKVVGDRHAEPLLLFRAQHLFKVLDKPQHRYWCGA
jgi:hypothetical protein